MQNNQRNEYHTTRTTEYRHTEPTRCGTACTIWTILGILASLGLITLAYSMGVQNGYREAYPLIAQDVRGQNVGVKPVENTPIPTVGQQVQEGMSAIASGTTAVVNTVASGTQSAVNTISSGTTAVVNTVASGANNLGNMVSMDGITLESGYKLLKNFSGNAALWKEKTGLTLSGDRFMVVDIDDPFMLLEVESGTLKKYELHKYIPDTHDMQTVWKGNNLPTTPDICNTFREDNSLDKSFALFANCKY